MKFNFPRTVAMSFRLRYKHRIDKLKYLILDKDRRSKSGKRIYVARGQTKSRRVINEDSLQPILEAHGFEVVTPGALSIAEQAREFADAELIIGAHGAAMTNLLFASPGTRFLEFMPDGYYHPGFKRICEVNGISYNVMTAEIVQPGSYDIEIRPEHIAYAAKL